GAASARRSPPTSARSSEPCSAAARGPSPRAGARSSARSPPTRSATSRSSAISRAAAGATSGSTPPPPRSTRTAAGRPSTELRPRTPHLLPSAATSRRGSTRRRQPEAALGVAEEDALVRSRPEVLPRGDARDEVARERVGVRVVGREDQALVADELDDARDGAFLRVAGDEALAAEVLARAQRELGGGVAPGVHVLVHALEPVREPAAAALEEDDAQPRVALEHAADQEAHAGDLLLVRVRADVAHREVVEAIAARLRHLLRRALVHGERHALLLE